MIDPKARKMEGSFPVDFGGDETQEESEAFYKAHFVNAGRTPPPSQYSLGKMFRIWLLLAGLLFGLMAIIEIAKG